MKKKKFQNSFIIKTHKQNLKIQFTSSQDYFTIITKKRVFILIDEYDTPLQMAYVQDKQKYLEDVTSFMGNLFSSSLKIIDIFIKQY